MRPTNNDLDKESLKTAVGQSSEVMLKFRDLLPRDADGNKFTGHFDRVMVEYAEGKPYRWIGSYGGKCGVIEDPPGRSRECTAEEYNMLFPATSQ